MKNRLLWWSACLSIGFLSMSGKPRADSSVPGEKPTPAASKNVLDAHQLAT
jgi:hypothetical protein